MKRESVAVFIVGSYRLQRNLLKPNPNPSDVTRSINGGMRGTLFLWKRLKLLIDFLEKEIHLMFRVNIDTHKTNI